MLLFSWWCLGFTVSRTLETRANFHVFIPSSFVRLVLACDPHAAYIMCHPNVLLTRDAQSTKAKGRTSSVGAHRDSSGGRTTSSKAAKAASAAAGGGARKKSSPADGVAKVMADLKGDITAVIDKAMAKVEAECCTFGERTIIIVVFRDSCFSQLRQRPLASLMVVLSYG